MDAITRVARLARAFSRGTASDFQHRNRPKDLLNKTEMRPTPEMLKRWEQLQDFAKRATPPSVIADIVFEEGIRQGKLYIIPHKETAQYIRNRFDGVMKDV